MWPPTWRRSILSTRCVNWGQHDPEADSTSCLAYIEAKRILKLAIIEGITVKEAWIKSGTLYSSIVKASTASRLTITIHKPNQSRIAKQGTSWALTDQGPNNTAAGWNERNERTDDPYHRQGYQNGYGRDEGYKYQTQRPLWQARSIYGVHDVSSQISTTSRNDGQYWITNQPPGKYYDGWSTPIIS